MADVFGDASLFAEFEKDREPNDRLLLSKCLDKPTLNVSIKTSNGDLIDTDENNEISDDDIEECDPEIADMNGETESRTVTESTDKNGEHVKSRQINTPKTKQANNLLEELPLESRRKDSLKEENEIENSRLKSHSKLIDPTKYVENESPVLQVLFMNNKLSRKYRTEIENFVLNLIFQEESEGRENLPHVKPMPSCVSFGERKDGSSSTVLGCSQFYQDFLVDSLGWPLVAQTPALTDGWAIPIYEQMYKHSYPCDEEDEDDLKLPQRSKAACFNCGGDHSVSECTEPKDMNRINQKRREFRMQNQNQKQSRYITDPRFASFKPGVISDDLRRALGLRKRQLPPYIYQMRVLGYPPGWLLNAKQEGSGITLFDKDGKEVSVDGDSVEEGEVDQKLYPDAQFDLTKIVDYPGFNVDPPEDAVDDWQKLGAPPMNPQQSKRVMQSFLSPSQVKPRSKRQLSQTSEPPSKKVRYEASDMELCDSGTEEDMRGAGHRTSKKRSVSSENSSRANTPTLDDLVSQQRELLAQLEDSERDSGSDAVEMEVVDSVGDTDDEGLVIRGVHSPSPSSRSTDSPFKPPLPPSPLPSEKPPLPLGTPPPTPPPVFAGNPPLPPSPLVCTPPPVPKGTPPPTPPHPLSADQTSLSEGAADTENSLLHTPTSMKRTGSVHMDLGTPILSDASPRLPEASKFAQGITDHLNFENLPNSTGSFEKMQGIIDRIRQGRRKSDA